MPEIDQSITVPVEADFTPFSKALGDLSKESQSFVSVFSSSMRSAITSGRSFEETLKSMALRMSSLALKAGLKPLENLAGNLLESFISNIAGGIGGGGGPPVLPFAKGGVVSSPTYFSAGSALGVAGEAGAEAILPLARGGDGRLGVRAAGAGAGGPPVNVTFNVSTPDVAGFSKSQTQISAMLARTVGRGRRGL